METQFFFNAVISVASVVGGVLLKSILDAIKELRMTDNELHDRITTITKDLPSTYIRRDDFISTVQRVENTLIRIENKLDEKKDKDHIRQ